MLFLIRENEDAEFPDSLAENKLIYYRKRRLLCQDLTGQDQLEQAR